MKNLIHIYSSAWFKSERLAIEKYGLNAFLTQEFNELFREFGAKESRKLKELGIVSGTDIDSIIRGLQFSHWALFEKIKLTKLSNNAAKMGTIGCTRQKYAKKKWGTEYPCKGLNFSLESRIGFVNSINPEAKVECNFCPPDSKRQNIPDNVSCEWIISVP